MNYIKYNPNIYSNLAFCANFSMEETSSNELGNLNHCTYFFREEDTDEFVQDYIRQHFADNKQINILSAGCSSGEELYSYACMLDDMKDKIHFA